MATLVLVERDRARARARPRSRSCASIRTTPLGALPGDHFIVRGFVATRGGGSTIGGGRDHPRARAEGAQGRAARGRGRRARAPRALDQRHRARRSQRGARPGSRIDELGAPARRCRRARWPSRSRRSSRAASCWPVGDVTTCMRRRSPSSSTKIARARRRADGHLARGAAHAAAGRAAGARVRRDPRRASSARGLVASDGDRVRKRRAATPAPHCRRPRPRCSAKLEATGVEPPRPKELPAARRPRRAAGRRPRSTGSSRRSSPSRSSPT